MNSAQLSAEQMMTIRETALFMAAVVGMWVVSDARSRGKDSIAAILWGIGAMLLMIVVLPLWFVLRPKATVTPTSSTRVPPKPAPSPFSAETARTPIPENGDAGRSKICDHCGKFYIGKHDKCPHCDVVLEK